MKKKAQIPRCRYCDQVLTLDHDCGKIPDKSQFFASAMSNILNTNIKKQDKNT